MLELDELDQKAAAAFPGHLVRKDLVRRFRGQFPVPTYVVEFMLGRYCASTDRGGDRGRRCRWCSSSSRIEPFAPARRNCSRPARESVAQSV